MPKKQSRTSRTTPNDECFRNAPWEDWDEDATPVKPLLFLNAATYKPAKLFDIPVGQRWERHYLVSPSGNFCYHNFLCPAYAPQPQFDEGCFLVWNGDVVVPALSDMNRRRQDGARFKSKTSEFRRACDGAVWMSLTPGEMLSQRSGVQKAEGKVLVGGLGLGWFLRKVCEKETVQEVVLVENSQELLDWYGYDLCRRYAKVTDVICDDVFAVAENFPDHQLLLDIWPVYQGRDSAQTDPRLKALRAHAGDRVWAWGKE
jgi:hypothetical protein